MSKKKKTNRNKLKNQNQRKKRKSHKNRSNLILIFEPLQEKWTLHLSSDWFAGSFHVWLRETHKTV